MGIILDNEETQKFVFIAGCFKDLPFSALHSALIAHPFPALEGVCMDRECLFNRRPQQTLPGYEVQCSRWTLTEKEWIPDGMAYNLGSLLQDDLLSLR